VSVPYRISGVFEEAPGCCQPGTSDRITASHDSPANARRPDPRR